MTKLVRVLRDATVAAVATAVLAPAWASAQTNGAIAGVEIGRAHV